jgi:spore coat polysaccharide biosynthesis predicted glycosyltransferase SpsG
MQKIYLITDVSKNTGYGHLARLTFFAEYLKKYGKIIFLLNKSKFFLEQMKKFTISKFNEKKFFKTNNKKNFFILDVKNIEKKYIDFYNKKIINSKKIIIYHKIPKKINYDYLLIPYLMKNKFINNKKIISGLASIILNKKLFKNYKVNSKKFIIFISMGASDNTNFTFKILNKLKFFFNKKDFQIRIFIGPYFKKKEITKIIQMKKTFKSIKIYFDQKTFVKLMKTSSLGIINSGNLKYEFAAIGKPFILISNDKNSVPFCKTFSDFFYCKFFGEFKVPSTKFFNNYIFFLRNNYISESKKFRYNKKKMPRNSIKNLCQKILTKSN